MWRQLRSLRLPLSQKRQLHWLLLLWGGWGGGYCSSASVCCARSCQVFLKLGGILVPGNSVGGCRRVCSCIRSGCSAVTFGSGGGTVASCAATLASSVAARPSSTSTIVPGSSSRQQREEEFSHQSRRLHRSSSGRTG